jgi:hypothetical protein
MDFSFTVTAGLSGTFAITRSTFETDQIINVGRDGEIHINPATITELYSCTFTAIDRCTNGILFDKFRYFRGM